MSCTDAHLTSRLKRSAKCRDRQVRYSSENDGKTLDSEDDKESVSDVVARLAAAEAEAQALRDALNAAQAGKEDLTELSQDELAKRKIAPPEQRIDGMGYRENLFSGPSAGQSKGNSGWLQESDLAFFTGQGATESGAAMSEEDQSTVNRRLIGGLVFTAAAGAFGLVPDRQVRPKPSKPLFFYLVPILRIQALIGDLETAAEAGEWGELRNILQRISKEPNNAKENLKSAAACLDDDKQFEKAESLIVEFLEYLSQVDFKNYYDNVGQVSVTQEMQFKDFSLQCAKAAGKKLDEFIRLMPEEQLGAARSQLNVF